MQELSKSNSERCLLWDASGVAVVEPYEEVGLNNAVLCNADDAERFRLKFPAPSSSGFGYDQAYYVGDTLDVFVNLGGSDFRYVIDESDGKFLGRYKGAKEEGQVR